MEQEVRSDRFCKISFRGTGSDRPAQERQSMSKKESDMIKGTAILFMIYHHLFCTPGSIFVPYSHLLGEQGELRLAWFGKICVALFAVVSGYGLCLGFKKYQKRTILNTLRDEYKNILVRVFHFYTLYWYVAGIYCIFWCILWKRTIPLGELILNLLAFSDSINGSWWYAGEYLKLLLLFPLLDLFFARLSDRRQNRIKAVLFLLLFLALGLQYVCGKMISASISAPLFTAAEFFMPDYLLCFGTGYILARFDLAEKIRAVMNRWKEPIRILAGLLLIAAVFAVRTRVTVNASYARFDFLLAPFFMLGLVLSVGESRHLCGILSWFGGLSSYMWLIQLLFLNGILAFLVLSVPQSTCIFLILTGLTTGASILLRAGYKGINMAVGKGRKCRHAKKEAS